MNMKKPGRVLCVAVSFVPAIFIWLAFQRYNGFQELMSNYLGSPRYEWGTPISSFVFGTIRLWPFVAVLGWLLLVPAMFNKPWCRKLRVGLILCFILAGPLLYGICLEGLNHAEMMVLETWHGNNKDLTELAKRAHQEIPQKMINEGVLPFKQ